MAEKCVGLSDCTTQSGLFTN